MKVLKPIFLQSTHGWVSSSVVFSTCKCLVRLIFGFKNVNLLKNQKSWTFGSNFKGRYLHDNNEFSKKNLTHVFSHRYEQNIQK